MSSDPHRDFAIPPGYSLLDPLSPDDDDQFDWDCVNNNPNLELWLIRIPNGLSAKHLQSIPLSLPSSRHPSKLGELTRKETTYDIWSCKPSLSDNDGDDASKPPVRGEEMNSITCLLPRRSKEGGLYAAPKPISRQVIVTSRPVVPRPDSQPDPLNGTPVTVYQNPPRHSYPPELLKHQFMPYGSLAPVDGAKRNGGLEKHKIELGSDSKDKENTGLTADMNDMNAEVAPPTPAKKATKEKKNRGEHEIEPLVTVEGSPHVPATEDRKTSKGKKRKGGGDISEAKKSKRRKREDV